jgi:hypothetical protein
MLAPRKTGAILLIPHTLRFYDLERWALPLFKEAGFVPKITQAAACTDIACAFCEVSSYHLEIKSLDLVPPFQDMYICDVCYRIYHWQRLLKTNCYNANERDALHNDTNATWACPACPC